MKKPTRLKNDLMSPGSGSEAGMVHGVTVSVALFTQNTYIVYVLPGAITLAVIPFVATSLANDFVNPSMPALLALYAVCPILPLLPITLPVKWNTFMGPLTLFHNETVACLLLLNIYSRYLKE